jgi:hypothetical protein
VLSPRGRVRRKRTKRGRATRNMLIDADLVGLSKCYVYGFEVKALLCCGVLIRKWDSNGGVKCCSEAGCLC